MVVKNISHFLDPDVVVAIALVREYGGVKPANTQKRKRLIQTMIEEGIIHPHLLNGIHPITMRCFKFYVMAELGKAKYGLGNYHELVAHNEALASQINLIPITVPMRSGEDIWDWCVKNDVCAISRTAMLSELPTILEKKWLLLNVNEDDYPLLKLKWGGS